MGDEEGALVPRMGWASRMVMCDEEVNMSVEDGTGDDVNWEDGNLFVKSVETVNESMTLGCHDVELKGKVGSVKETK